MKYRRLGDSGLIVSEIALGTMQFGQTMNMGNLNLKQTEEMIKFALDKGINFIDTADVYSLGQSEEFVGEAIKGCRKEIVLATKCRLPMSENMNRSGATRVNILRGVESSLSRLKTDYIDLYQLHGWDSITPLEETVRAMDDLVRQGKVRYIGISNYQAWQATEALGLQRHLGLNTFITAQMYYSLIGRGLEEEFIPMAEYHNLGILVWSPLAGGFLSGKYERDTSAPRGTRFNENGNFVPIDRERGYSVIDALKEVSARHSVSVPRIALAWLLHRPCISSVIIAARTQEHLLDNLSASEMELTHDDMNTLNNAGAEEIRYPKWMVLQLDVAEDPRHAILHPEKFENGSPWKDRRDFKWDTPAT